MVDDEVHDDEEQDTGDNFLLVKLARILGADAQKPKRLAADRREEEREVKAHERLAALRAAWEAQQRTERDRDGLELPAVPCSPVEQLGADDAYHRGEDPKPYGGEEGRRAPHAER